MIDRSTLRILRLEWILGILAFLPFSLSAQTDCAVQTEIPLSQCAALLSIYHGLGGPNWVTDHTDWNTNNQPCTWSGISCNGGQVTSLQMSSTEFVGAVPPALGDLPGLRVLALFGGRQGLTGPIPPEIGNLKDMFNLTIGGLRNGGQIPAEIGQLGQIQFLSLQQSDFTGAVPESIGNLTQLLHLTLVENQLTSLPASIGNLSALRTLRARHNLLTALPEEIGNLSQLTLLLLTRNEIAGPFPMQLLNLPVLDYLGISFNELSGPLPPELATIGSGNISTLFLVYNDFSGPIPSDLATLDAEITVAGNQLTGEVPAEFGQGSSNLILRISYNCLTVSDPTLRTKLATWDNQWERTQCMRIFDDGFSTGDFSRWSSSVGGASGP